MLRCDPILRWLKWTFHWIMIGNWLQLMLICNRTTCIRLMDFKLRQPNFLENKSRWPRLPFSDNITFCYACICKCFMYSTLQPWSCVCWFGIENLIEKIYIENWECGAWSVCCIYITWSITHTIYCQTFFVYSMYTRKE